MKYPLPVANVISYNVALFTRAWIEIRRNYAGTAHIWVALFTRAWIEI